MTPNQVTLARVGMAFVAVALFGRRGWPANLTALGLTVAAIALDAVDGYLARRKNLATPFGAQLDILGDRVIENVFFTYFAVCGAISFWVPVIFFVRGTMTDFLRALAAKEGRVGFGKNSMLESRWARLLVASRASRFAYGALKCACFCYLGFERTLLRPTAGTVLSADWTATLLLGAQVIVAATVAFCLVRGVPVLWEGRRYLGVVAKAAPRTSAAPVRRAAALRVGSAAGAVR